MGFSTTIARDPVNKVIGDSSLEGKFDQNLTDIDEQSRIRIHLKYVENFIRNQSSLSLMKCNALDYLNGYWTQGQFPAHNRYQQEGGQQQRLPRFIDHNGVHCAVGYMILKSPGFEHLPNQINTNYEYSFIDEIGNSNNSDLTKWMNMYEFNLNELAMIQPTYEHMRRPQKKVWQVPQLQPPTPMASQTPQASKIPPKVPEMSRVRAFFRRCFDFFS
ncbi:unnamed protein product [Rotaria sp. Silwood2]|nr:unnamed protein product [Rotaria sp. Silwood2]CAF3415392.1 unnamed protein product [Rotaria sp. Silwood2]CAF4306899.1 unnamed protein product [Rotaria sp. Silwood2]CAF4551901.1 unnamed protein product [Rotaria sp. Silwood2]